MTEAGPGGRQSRAFLVAAVALPLVVAAFFLLAVTIPRWTVAAPNHDLLVRIQRYGGPQATTTIDIQVENGTVVATAKPVAKDLYPPRWVLLLVDPLAGSAREVPLGVPSDLPPDAAPVRQAVPELSGVTVSPDPVAPDGYHVQAPSTGGPGVVGGLFGMRRGGARLVVEKQGRTVRVDLPQSEMDPYGPVHVVGWIVSPKSR